MTNTTQLQLSQNLQLDYMPIFMLDINDEGSKSKELIFEQVILGALDIAFGSIDEKSGQTIYNELERKYALRKEEIPNKLEDLAQAIDILFDQAAVILEIKIMQTIHQKIPNFKFFTNTSEISFVDYLQSVKSFLI